MQKIDLQTHIPEGGLANGFGGPDYNLGRTTEILDDVMTRPPDPFLMEGGPKPQVPILIGHDQEDVDT